ncbi:hypothetical protein MKQ70_07680 [Chitinophaga sedimenti]|uniref:hypothetical protein n=1 Tax=Chitinophaga sedimenti TaxID=2033606 RepID=UPI002005AACE|nr:hypothetical protein [Chitinophaga sedimenti]MCK7554889.1 hypothetical protein [Chitinophaga sedimenti]
MSIPAVIIVFLMLFFGCGTVIHHGGEETVTDSAVAVVTELPDAPVVMDSAMVVED